MKTIAIFCPSPMPSQSIVNGIHVIDGNGRSSETKGSTAALAASKRTDAAAESDVRNLLLLMDKDKNGTVSKEEFLQYLSQAFDQFVALLFDFGAPHGSASYTSLTRELSLLDEVRRDIRMRLSATDAAATFSYYRCTRQTMSGPGSSFTGSSQGTDLPSASTRANEADYVETSVTQGAQITM